MEKFLLLFKPKRNTFRFIGGILTLIIFTITFNLSNAQISPGWINVNPPPGGFQIDGDLQANTTLSPTFTVGQGDWIFGPGGIGDSVLYVTGAPIIPSTTFHLYDLYNNSLDNIFDGGIKIDDDPNSMSWNLSKSNAKDDVNNALLHFTFDATGNLWLVFSADRYGTVGASYMDFEFLQNTLEKTTDPLDGTKGGFSSEGPDGGRTDGDILLTVTFSNSGATFDIRRWESTGTTFEYVPYTSPLDGNSAYAAINTTSVPVPYGAFGSNTYEAYAFVEAALNFTKVFNEIINPCKDFKVKTIFVRSKTSASSSAQVKDFIDPLQFDGLSLGAANAGADAKICPGESYQIIDAHVTPSSGYEVVSTTWTSTTTCGSIISGQNTLTPTVAVNPGCDSAVFRLILVTKPAGATDTQTYCTVWDEMHLTAKDTEKPVVSCKNATVYLSSSGTYTLTPDEITASKSDNCTISSTTISKSAFTCADVGNNSVTLTVTDASGNVATCVATVTVVDNIPPVAICKDVTVQLDAAGNGSTTAVAVDNGSNDACGIKSLELSKTSFNCSNVGNNSVVLTVTDNNNNTATCTATVVVQDNVPPVAICQNVTVLLDANGNGSTTASAVNNGSSDACGLGTITLSKTSFNCSNLGSNLVTLTVPDINGNNSTCTATVTVQDNIPPTISCTGGQSVCPQVPGEITYKHTNTSWDALASDNCSVSVTFSLSGATSGTGTTLSGTTFNLGITTVTWTAVDNSSNSNTCSFTVDVHDCGVPQISCSNPTVCANSTCNYHNSGTGFDAIATDDVGVTLLTWSLTGATTMTGTWTVDGVTFGLGVTTAVWTAMDAAGNTSSCTSTITVNDCTPPLITCVENKTVGMNEDCRYLNESDWDATATDNCGVVTLTYTLTGVTTGSGATLDGKYFNKGVTIVTWTAKDAAGHMSTCSSTVTVNDDIFPSINCPSNIVKCNDTGLCSALASYSVSASDNCEGLTLTQTAGLPSGVQYPVGVTTNVWKATDASGNTVTCSFTVTVNDCEPPVCSVKNITITQPWDNNPIPVTPEMILNSTPTDNCGVETYWVVPDILQPVAEDHTYLVDLVVRDIHGLTSTCTAEIFRPYCKTTLVCNPITVYLTCTKVDPWTLNVHNIADLTAGTTSTCGPLDFKVSPRYFDCNHVASSPNPVTITATDVTGNVETCQTYVTVLDTCKPVMKCKDITVTLDASGKALIFPGNINDDTNLESVPSRALTYNHLAGGSWDNCGIVFACLDNEQTSQMLTCANVGSNIVTLKMTDPSGNIGTCTATVTVVDNIPPVMAPVNSISKVVEPGVCTTKISNYPVVTATDVCPVTVTLTGGLGSNGDFPLGTTTEIYKAVDAGGNMVTTSFNVTVSTYNGAPAIGAIADVTAAEDVGTVTVPLTGISWGADCTAQTFTVTASSGNTTLVTNVAVNHVTGSATGSLVLTVAPNKSGEAVITVTVKDSGGTANGGVDTTVKSFKVTVSPVNDPPTLVSGKGIADQTVNSARTLEVPIPATLGAYFDDVDGDALTITAMKEGGAPLPAYITTASGKLIIKPLLVDMGNYNIVVKATDPSGAAATDTFKLTILGYVTGIEDIGNGVFEVKMYPNPTRGPVNLDMSGSLKDMTVSVFNILGVELFRKDYKTPERITFNLSQYSSGMYFVKLKYENQEVVKKLILDKQ